MEENIDKDKYNKFEEQIKETTLYELKNQFKEAKSELKMLKEDPAASHDEIAKLDTKLSKWMLEYAARVADLKLKMKY
jgi:ribosome recycling factor